MRKTAKYGSTPLGIIIALAVLITSISLMAAAAGQDAPPQPCPDFENPYEVHHLNSWWSNDVPLDQWLNCGAASGYEFSGMNNKIAIMRRHSDTPPPHPQRHEAP